MSLRSVQVSAICQPETHRNLEIFRLSPSDLLRTSFQHSRSEAVLSVSAPASVPLPTPSAHPRFTSFILLRRDCEHLRAPALRQHFPQPFHPGQVVERFPRLRKGDTPVPQRRVRDGLHSESNDKTNQAACQGSPAETTRNRSFFLEQTVSRATHYNLTTIGPTGRPMGHSNRTRPRAVAWLVEKKLKS